MEYGHHLLVVRGLLLYIYIYIVVVSNSRDLPSSCLDLFLILTY